MPQLFRQERINSQQLGNSAAMKSNEAGACFVAMAIIMAGGKDDTVNCCQVFFLSSPLPPQPQGLGEKKCLFVVAHRLPTVAYWHIQQPSLVRNFSLSSVERRYRLTNVARISAESCQIQLNTLGTDQIPETFRLTVRYIVWRVLVSLPSELFSPHWNSNLHSRLKAVNFKSSSPVVKLHCDASSVRGEAGRCNQVYNFQGGTSLRFAPRNEDSARERLMPRTKVRQPGSICLLDFCNRRGGRVIQNFRFRLLLAGPVWFIMPRKVEI